MDKPEGNLPGPTDVSQRISVCIVAMHPMVLSALKQALDSNAFQTVPNKPVLGSSQLERMEIPVASVYVIDSAGIPSGPLEIVRQIVSHNAKAHIIVLAESFDESTAFPLLNLGVKGLIAHEFVTQQLPHALQSVAASGSHEYCCRDLSIRLSVKIWDRRRTSFLGSISAVASAKSSMFSCLTCRTRKSPAGSTFQSERSNFTFRICWLSSTFNVAPTLCCSATRVATHPRNIPRSQHHRLAGALTRRFCLLVFLLCKNYD